MNQKPGKGKFRELKSEKIPLEACSLGPSFRKSVSIYSRSAPEFAFEVILISLTLSWLIVSKHSPSSLALSTEHMVFLQSKATEDSF